MPPTLAFVTVIDVFDEDLAVFNAKVGTSKAHIPNVNEEQTLQTKDRAQDDRQKPLNHMQLGNRIVELYRLNLSDAESVLYKHLLQGTQAIPSLAGKKDWERHYNAIWIIAVRAYTAHVMLDGE